MIAVAKLWLGLAILVVVAAALVSQETGRADGEASAVRDCAQRVEGGLIRPRAPRDTVAGPIGWYRLPSKFSPSQAGKESDGYPSPPVKALAVVRAPKAVTVWVPAKRRPWMQLIYVRSSDGSPRGTDRVMFRPCSRSSSAEDQRRECVWEPFKACRSGYTQFNGGIFVDYEKAPKKGRCARVAVRVEGETRVRRPLLFGPADGRCRA